MSTVYYICRKQDYERSIAIKEYVERIRRTLHSYLDASLPPELKDDLQLTDDLEDAVAPMCSKLSDQISYEPEVRLCTITASRIIWHQEEASESGFTENDELVVVDEYGETLSFREFLRKIGKSI